MKQLLLYVCIALFFFSCRKENTDPYALPDAYSNQALGRSANDLLSAAKYSILNIEVQYMPGYKLEDAAVTNITTFLNSLCNKPGGIIITQTQVTGSGDTLSPDKIALLEKQNRTSYTSGSTISVYILVTDGYDTSATRLGYAYRNTSLCLLGKNIFDHSGGIGNISRVALESSVLEHELGHILGLVNLGSPMQQNHQDADHNNHCTNTKCLMYYAVQTHKGLGSYTAIPALDSNCLNDLRANGGK